MRRTINDIPIVTLKKFARRIEHELVDTPNIIIPHYQTSYGQFEGATITRTEYQAIPWTMSYECYQRQFNKGLRLSHIVAKQFKSMAENLVRCPDVRTAYYTYIKEGHYPSHIVRIAPREYVIVDIEHFCYFKTGMFTRGGYIKGSGILVNRSKNNIVAFKVDKS